MNKKILIIGQKGLIGSNLFKYLKQKKLAVYSISFENFLSSFILGSTKTPTNLVFFFLNNVDIYELKLCRGK